VCGLCWHGDRACLANCLNKIVPAPGGSLSALLRRPSFLLCASMANCPQSRSVFAGRLLPLGFPMATPMRAAPRPVLLPATRAGALRPGAHRLVDGSRSQLQTSMSRSNTRPPPSPVLGHVPPEWSRCWEAFDFSGNLQPLSRCQRYSLRIGRPDLARVPGSAWCAAVTNNVFCWRPPTRNQSRAQHDPSARNHASSSFCCSTLSRLELMRRHFGNRALGLPLTS